jgi:hypothetical protein
MRMRQHAAHFETAEIATALIDYQHGSFTFIGNLRANVSEMLSCSECRAISPAGNEFIFAFDSTRLSHALDGQ